MKSKTITWLSIILFIAFFAGYGCKPKLKEPEKPISPEKVMEKPETNRIENWEISLPENGIIQVTGKNVFLLGKCENGIVQVVEKNTWDEEERVIWEYQNHSDSNYLLALTTSADGRQFACYSNKGLMIMNRDDGSEKILEENPIQKTGLEEDAMYSYYIKDIQWSYDNQYLALQYIGFESSAVFIYDILNKKKLTPVGDGILSGWHLQWSPVGNIFLDPSNDYAYGEPGFYISDQGSVDHYSDISSELGMNGCLFYKAIFTPDGKQIDFIRSAEILEDEFMLKDENIKKLIAYDLESKKTTEIVQDELADVLFFSENGNKLFFCTKGNGKTKIQSYDLVEKKIQNEVTILSDLMDIRNVLWMGEDNLGIEIINWNEDHSFKDTRVICLDLKSQKIGYASPAYPFEIKLLKSFMVVY